MKNLRIVLLACLLLCILAGCGSGASSAQEEQVSYTTLRLDVWMEVSEVSDLVEQFNATHTDYQIETVSYYEDGKDIDAAIDQITTKFILGDIPDIIWLNSLDVAAIENAGLLQDLYPLMEQDESFQEDDYFMKIWALFEQDGCPYEFVPTFEIGGITGPASVLGEDRTGWTFAEFAELMNSWTDSQTLIGTTQSTMATYLAQFSCEEFVDLEQGTCDFENEDFYEWLEFLTLFPETVQSGAVLRAGWITGLDRYVSLEEDAGTQLVCTGFPSASGGGPCAMSLNSFGISAKTEYPEACWEFLMQLMDAETSWMFANDMGGFSMSREAFTLAVDQELEPYEDENGELVYDTTQESMDALTELIESIDRVRFRYDGIMDLITEEAQTYLAGDATAERTAYLIQERVTTFLDERN